MGLFAGFFIFSSCSPSRQGAVNAARLAFRRAFSIRTSMATCAVKWLASRT
jgi:hypothetical protein